MEQDMLLSPEERDRIRQEWYTRGVLKLKESWGYDDLIQQTAQAQLDKAAPLIRAGVAREIDRYIHTIKVLNTATDKYVDTAYYVIDKVDWDELKARYGGE